MFCCIPVFFVFVFVFGDNDDAFDKNELEGVELDNEDNNEQENAATTDNKSTAHDDKVLQIHWNYCSQTKVRNAREQRGTDKHSRSQCTMDNSVHSIVAVE